MGQTPTAVPFSENMGGKTMVLDEVTLALLSTGALSCHLVIGQTKVGYEMAALV